MEKGYLCKWSTSWRGWVGPRKEKPTREKVHRDGVWQRKMWGCCCCLEEELFFPEELYVISALHINSEFQEWLKLTPQNATSERGKIKTEIPSCRCCCFLPAKIDTTPQQQATTAFSLIFDELWSKKTTTTTTTTWECERCSLLTWDWVGVFE